MGPGKIILIAVLAGIYSGVLDSVEEYYRLNNFLSSFFLILLTYITGFILYKIGTKKKQNDLIIILLKGAYVSKEQL